MILSTKFELQIIHNNKNLKTNPSTVLFSVKTCKKDHIRHQERQVEFHKKYK